MIAAIADAVEQARRAAAKPFQPAADMRGPALLNKAACPIAVEGIGKILAAVNIAASIIRVRSCCHGKGVTATLLSVHGP